jgi:hypothetical protein
MWWVDEQHHITVEILSLDDDPTVEVRNGRSWCGADERVCWAPAHESGSEVDRPPVNEASFVKRPHDGRTTLNEHLQAPPCPEVIKKFLEA